MRPEAPTPARSLNRAGVQQAEPNIGEGAARMGNDRHDSRVCPERSRSASILIVGSLALDEVETPFGSVSEMPGGAALYAALAASLFAPVRLVGAVGTDFPSHMLDQLQARGVDLEGLEIRQGKTFRWRARYEYDMAQARTLSTELGVFSGFHPRLPDSYLGTPFVFLANIDPELQLEVLDAVGDASLAACDSNAFWIEGKREEVLKVLARCNMALLNDAEVRQLCGKSNIVAAASALLKMGPSWAVVKKGEHGALLFGPDATFAAPAYPMEDVVDPTGAGDSFAGALLGYLACSGELSQENLRRAVVCGSVVASFVVERFGPDRLLALTQEEVTARYNEFLRVTHFTPI